MSLLSSPYLLVRVSFSSNTGVSIALPPWRSNTASITCTADAVVAQDVVRKDGFSSVMRSCQRLASTFSLPTWAPQCKRTQDTIVTS